MGLQSLKMITIATILLLMFLLYKYTTRNFDYWHRKGVSYVKPIPFFGNVKDVFLQKKQLGHFLAEQYTKMNSRFFGMYMLNKPFLVLKDLNLIKQVLVKDFNYFCDHTPYLQDHLDPIGGKTLFFSHNPEWRFMRTNIAAVFTPAKIKQMVPAIRKAAEDMNTYIKMNIGKPSQEAREICAKFSTNVVVDCAFGLEAKCFEESSDFRKIGKMFFSFDFVNAYTQLCYYLAPDIVRTFKLPFYNPKTASFLRKVIWNNIKDREENNYKRNDIIDMLLQIRQKKMPNAPIVFDGDYVVASAAQFYLAGFETISNTMSFTLYELALQPQIQENARKEIMSAIEEFGELDFDAIKSMKYLHYAVCETLRMYPILPFLDRECVQDYQLPNSQLIINKGTAVYIPMLGLHYDPEYFPEPAKYNPERFGQDNVKLLPFSYIPFGEGPRICIGERFGLLVAKMGLAHILSKFVLETSAETPIPVQFEKNGFLLGSVNGMPIKFKQL